MTRIPTTRVVREDGLVELPIVLDFDFSDPVKVVGFAAVDPDLLPQEPTYCFALGYVSHDDGRAPEVTCLSIVQDADYMEVLREEAGLREE